MGNGVSRRPAQVDVPAPVPPVKETGRSRKKKTGKTTGKTKKGQLKAIVTPPTAEDEADCSSVDSFVRPFSAPRDENEKANAFPFEDEVDVDGCTDAIPASPPASGPDGGTDSGSEEAETPSPREDPDSQGVADGDDGLGVLLDRMNTASTATTNTISTATPYRRKKLKKLNVKFSLGSSLREVITDVIKELGWKETEDSTDWQLMWMSTTLHELKCMKLRRPQRVNHFPGMYRIAHKCELAHNIDLLKQALPAHYDFHPDSFKLPADRQAFEDSLAAAAAAKEGDGEGEGEGEGEDKCETFIVKPDDGACGHGIFLTRTAADVPRTLACVAQRYMDSPLLIDGRKFDLRLYVLVTSIQPLRIYLHHQGLARFASDKYEKVTPQNMSDTYMHLTNYSVNKTHPDFQVVEQPADQDGATAGGSEGENNGGDSEGGPEAVGGKRSAEWVRRWLGDNGFSVAGVWGQIEELVVKTLLAVQPQLLQTYRTCVSEFRDSAGFSCFEILGFDVMLDAKGKPWLIEVNENPSWETSSPMDYQVKHAVLAEALQMVCPTTEEFRLLTAPTRAPTLPSLPAASPPPATAHAAAEGARERLVGLRVRQERYYARGYRQLYPLEPPVPPSRPNTGATALSAASRPHRAQAKGWAFLGGGARSARAAAEREEERREAYAACLAAAEAVCAASPGYTLQPQRVERGDPPKPAGPAANLNAESPRGRQETVLPQLGAAARRTASGRPAWVN